MLHLDVIDSSTIMFVLFSGRNGEFYPDGIANSINFQRASPEAALSRELQAGLDDWQS